MLISLHRYGFVLDTFFCEELESGSSFGRARLGNICIKESPNEDTTFEWLQKVDRVENGMKN